MTALVWGRSPMNAHNDYLNTLCEWGLAGFGVIIVALGLLFGGVSRIWPYLRRGSGDMGARNSSRAAFVLGASLGLLSILIHSAVDFNMQIPANAVTAIALMALLSAHWRFGTERFWVNPGSSEKSCSRLPPRERSGFWHGKVSGGSEFYWLERGLNATSWRGAGGGLEDRASDRTGQFHDRL